VIEADGSLLTLPSYPLLSEKARLIGTMFHMTMVPILAQRSRLGFACERGRRNSTRGAARASRWCILHPDSTSLRMRLVRETPEAFAWRTIFSGNRPHQNKYETSAWAQEAGPKGSPTRRSLALRPPKRNQHP
jgi:hypothetical protein